MTLVPQKASPVFKVLSSITKSGHDVVEYDTISGKMQCEFTHEKFVEVMRENELLKRQVQSSSKTVSTQYDTHHAERARLEKERDNYALRLTERNADLRLALEKIEALVHHRKLDAALIKSLQEQAERDKQRITDMQDVLHLRGLGQNLATPKNPEGNNMYLYSNYEYATAINERNAARKELHAYKTEADRWKREAETFRAEARRLTELNTELRQRTVFPAEDMRLLLDYHFTPVIKLPGRIAIPMAQANDAAKAVREYLDKFFPVLPPTVEKMRGGLHAAGRAKYGDAWDSVRHALAAAVSKGRTNSTKSLTRDEYEELLNIVQAAE